MADSLRVALNRVNPNTLADGLRLLGGLGNFVRQYAHHVLVGKIPAATSYDLATVQSIVPDNSAPAVAVLWAFATAGTVSGQLVPTTTAAGAAPTTGQVAVTPCGNIGFLATDAITAVDVLYAPLPGEVVELTGVVASNAFAIPTAWKNRKVLLCLEAEALAGTSVGKKIVLIPSASAAAAGQARLDLLRQNVKFAPADAVTSCRVKLYVAPAVDIDATLQANSAIL